MSNETGFKSYQYVDKSGNVHLLAIDQAMSIRLDDLKTYSINTDNIEIRPSIRKPLPWHKKMWNRVKGAWSLLLRGDDYHE